MSRESATEQDASQNPDPGFPFTPSEAFLNLLLKDRFDSNNPENNIRIYIEEFHLTQTVPQEHRATQTQFFSEDHQKRSFVTTCVEIIGQEKTHANDYVFYHGVNRDVAFLYLLYTEVYAAIQDISCEDDQLLKLRPFDEVFSDITEVSDFFQKVAVLHRNPKRDDKFNYRTGYAERGISANFCPFVGVGIPSSNTFDYWTRNACSQPPNIDAALNYFFSSLGFSEKQQKKWVEKSNALLNDETTGLKTGGLVQIFISPEAGIDQIAYIAEEFGRPLLLDWNKTTEEDKHAPPYSKQRQGSYGFKDFVDALRTDPEELESTLKANHGHFHYQSNNSKFQEKETLHTNYVETRLILNPRVLNQHGKLYFHVADQQETYQAFRQKLRAFVQTELKTQAQKHWNNNLRIIIANGMNDSFATLIRWIQQHGWTKFPISHNRSVTLIEAIFELTGIDGVNRFLTACKENFDRDNTTSLQEMFVFQQWLSTLNKESSALWLETIRTQNSLQALRETLATRDQWARHTVLKALTFSLATLAFCTLAFVCLPSLAGAIIVTSATLIGVSFVAKFFTDSVKIRMQKDRERIDPLLQTLKSQKSELEHQQTPDKSYGSIFYSGNRKQTQDTNCIPSPSTPHR